MVVQNDLPAMRPWTDADIDALVLDERRSCRRLDDADLMHYGRMAKAALRDAKEPDLEWYRVWMRARLRAVTAEWKWRSAEVDVSLDRSYRQWIDDAKARVDLLDLMDLPARSRVVRCPLHDDRQASLSVDAERGLWNCFGCGRKGDVLTWLAEAEGLEWADALERLERLSGLTRPRPDPRRLKGVTVYRDDGHHS